jgi:2-phosphosulfolactate phosphatase
MNERVLHMAKLHLLMKKEDIDARKLKENNKIAVVFDVLLATSTITAGLHFGAKEVIPVLDEKHAKKKAEGRHPDSYILVGEYEGKTIDGFLDPNPLKLQNSIQGKTMILSTTNGTVAINKCSDAKKVYICSLLNGKAVAEAINHFHKNETIIVVCSGSSGEFNMEDFFGAGYFIDSLLNVAGEDWELTDSAMAALYFYRNSSTQGKEILLASRVGKMLKRYGCEEEVEYVAREGILPIVPYLTEDFSIVKSASNEYVVDEK